MFKETILMNTHTKTNEAASTSESTKTAYDEVKEEQIKEAA